MSMLWEGICFMTIGIAGRYALRGYKTVRARTFIKNQDAFKLYKGGFYNEMNRREAQLILGVTEGSDQKVIKDRHRKLMLINHPDNGGSTYLATKINQAKDLLGS